jgi:hypothetical protein
MTPKPWIPNALMPRHPNPVPHRKSHKSWDPNYISSTAKFVAGPYATNRKLRKDKRAP